MQRKLIDFTNLLRKSGVRVSVAESIDAFFRMASGIPILPRSWPD